MTGEPSPYPTRPLPSSPHEVEQQLRLVQARQGLRVGVGSDGVRTLLDVASTSLEGENFQASANALVTALALQLPADRVSLGIVVRERVKLEAVSHAIDVDRKTVVSQAIVEAMEEAYDQQQLIQWPPSPSAPPAIVRAHRELAHRFRASAVCSIPLRVGQRLIGVLTIERAVDELFSEEEVALCEAVACFAAPVIDLKRKDDRALVVKVADEVGGALHRLIGPGHLTLKFMTLVLSAVLAVAVLATGEFRVASKAVLEGEIQQAAVAPFDGYLHTAMVRAGDQVRAGQVLASLEDRDIQLERLKWLSQQEQIRKEHRQALADRDAAKVQILTAQLRQAEAELALAAEKLSRVQVTAPFDAVVVSGDLSQRLGSPVKKGETLFELAPLDSYRIIMEVDEHDVAHVSVAQRGRLVLSALPHDVFDLVVTAVTPVANAREGRNYFRVEGRFDAIPPHIRPAMEGVAKIIVDQRSLLWIWLHDALDWVKIKFWTWLP